MIRPQLRAALDALAAPAHEQRALFDPDLCAADQLLLDLDLAIESEMEAVGTAPMLAIVLYAFAAQCVGREGLHSDEALATSPRWAEIRHRAAETLDELASENAEEDDDAPWKA